MIWVPEDDVVQYKMICTTNMGRASSSKAVLVLILDNLEATSSKSASDFSCSVLLVTQYHTRIAGFWSYFLANQHPMVIETTVDRTRLMRASQNIPQGLETSIRTRSVQSENTSFKPENIDHTGYSSIFRLVVYTTAIESIKSGNGRQATTIFPAGAMSYWNGLHTVSEIALHFL